MGKNIVIFSDGTGQRGGVLFDEARTNIYKLYRATRCGPDSNVDPTHQLTFYDPGIGTVRGGIGLRHQQQRSRWQTIALADRFRNVLFLSDTAPKRPEADNNEKAA